MAYLTTEERSKLLNELKNMSFNQANGKLRHIDPHGRLVYYRNAQTTGRWLTRYELTGLGTRVTLVESHSGKATEKANRLKSTFELVDVIVEPTSDNRN